MWRWTKRIVAGLLGLLVVMATSGLFYQWITTRRDLAATPPPGSLIDVGGHRLHIWCVGTGQPTVVHDAGVGAGAFSLAEVTPEVAKFTRICTYDRAGMGYSDSGPMPRTSRQIASELVMLLDGADIEAPVVLAGASFGGWTVRMVASEQPERVAGLVLLDVPHEDQRAREEAAGIQSDIPPFAAVVPAVASMGVLRLLGVTLGPSPESASTSVRDFVRATVFRTSRFSAMASELTNTPESAAQLRSARHELQIPLVVLSAGRVREGPGSEITRELQNDLATLSSQSCHVVAREAGHVIENDDPTLVVAAIRAVIRAARDPSVGLECDGW